jgi:hypothetical protein
MTNFSGGFFPVSNKRVTLTKYQLIAEEIIIRSVFSKDFQELVGSQKNLET